MEVATRSPTNTARARASCPLDNEATPKLRTRNPLAKARDAAAKHPIANKLMMTKPVDRASVPT
jgi:hypothetical protein